MAIDLNNRKNSTIIVMLIGGLFLVLISIQFFSMKNPSSYSKRMEVQRETKDRQFRVAPDSPIKQEERSQFEGLSYFPVDENYKVEGTYEEEVSKDTLILMTSTGTIRAIVQAGKVHFDLQGIPHALIAYQYLEGDDNLLFVPFWDLTSGAETYGGGRYMDIPLADELVVDFNLAYNPYCVYNDSYECPLPPRDNRLDIEIRAGEKDYKL